MKLLTGHKYAIGNNIYEVVNESWDSCCIDECSIENCTSNKDFKQFLNDCNCAQCIELLGIGRCFKKVK